ncbi:MAG: hypothetical protein R3F53_08780 [Gammaproteobacteria bacterium]
MDTEISPELILYADSTQPAQSTEAKIGPYELQDFNLYYTTRFGFRPSKVAFLSYQAWRDRNQGRWPTHWRQPNTMNTIWRPSNTGWKCFYFDFSRPANSNAAVYPTAPKQFRWPSSPRGDWRAPSDSSAAICADELRRNVPDA